MGVRTLLEVNRDLEEAVRRKGLHTDPASREGNRITIDGLLDEYTLLNKDAPSKELVPVEKVPA